MLQTSTPKINAVSFKSRHAKIVSMETTIDGDTIFTYEFSITVDTSLALSYDITTLYAQVQPSGPKKDMPSNLSAESLNHMNYIQNTAGGPTGHADMIDTGYQPPSSPGGGFTVEEQASLSNNNSLPGFGGDFSMQGASISNFPDQNSTTLSAVLNFEKIYRSFLINKDVGKLIFNIASENFPVTGFIDTRISNNFKNKMDELSTTIKASGKLSLFTPLLGSSGLNVSFYTGDPVIKLVKPRATTNSQQSGGPSLTSVINDTAGLSPGLQPGGRSYSRGSGNSPKATNNNQGVNNKMHAVGKGISNFNTRFSAFKGTNVFLSDFKTAAFRLIYDYGIAPSAAIPVNVDNTVVSVMQNFQGTSNLKYNGS